MLRNYFKIALRTAAKQKGYAFLNVAGLVTGIVCCLLIVLYVQDELRYDRFHEEADRIYRVTAVRGNPDQLNASANTALPIGPALQAEYPEVLEAVRARRLFDPIFQYEAVKATERRVYAVDSTFLEVFSFPLLRGDPTTALDQPDAVVLTETAARRYFGDVDPLGRTLTYRSSDVVVALTVTGVLRDVPSFSHLKFDALLSLGSFAGRFAEDWEVFLQNYTYLLLSDGTTPATLEAKLGAFVTRHVGVEADSDYTYRLHLQPLADIHLRSHLASEAEPNGDITYVYLFSIIAFFILLVACINFINLSTARSAQRAREVGLRKVIGAQRTQLIGQFLGESVLLGLGAMMLSLLTLEVVLPIFNEFTGKTLALNYAANGTLMLVLLGIVLFIGLAAGAYPALFLSAFQPVTVLKGTRHHHRSLGRQALVVFQFTVSIALIICTGVVLEQMRYVQSKDLGFDKEQVVAIPIDTEVGARAEAIKASIVRNPNVVSASASMLVPSTEVWTYGVRVEASNEPMTLGTYMVDYDFLDTYGMEVIAGRWFSVESGTDVEEGALINEATARRLGYSTPDEALGVRLIWAGQRTVTIIGVVKDFHVVSFREVIEPMIFLINPEYYYLSVRLAADDIPATLAFLEATMETFAPQRPFEYFFVDDRFDALHRADIELGQTFGAFSILATLIACLGLFGLAAFTAEQRTKEVGVRKVLGANVTRIVMLLSKDFTRLVIVALVVAAPLAYFAMHRWLDGFAYRVDISWSLFLGAGLLALAITFLTVSYQSIRAAVRAPVESLRYE